MYVCMFAYVIWRRGADFEMLQFDKRARILGNGGFGTVSVATLGTMSVAVKKLNNQSVRVNLLEEMRRDIEAYQQLQVRQQGETQRERETLVAV